MDQLMTLMENVIRNLRAIAVTDIIDIAIMAFIVYKLLHLVRSSSSGKVLKGIAFVVGALLLSDVMRLYTVNFLLSRMLEVGVLALVILFQPEIRKFLEQVGSSPLGGVFTIRQAAPDELDTAIAQTVEAYTELSKSKIGALTVFERNNLLDEPIRTGTAMDAAVNSQLLKNLFWNKAPLHDGALIIRKGRIVGAGCMLPLSGNVNLSKDLGMRHRAGIGVSEQTDAVVAIVSEETGSISVAVNGMLKRHLTPETLERLLRNELLPDKEETETPKVKLQSLFRVRKEGMKNGNDQRP